MKDYEERLRNLEQLRDSLTLTLGDVNREINKILAQSARMPDSFSEDKEGFVAP